MNIQLAELIFCVVMVQEVRCRSKGAPSSACSDMTPLHHNVPQSRPPPYSISVSKKTYNPGEQITVTLQANSGVAFKGFLIQPRRNPNTNDTIGTFIQAPGTKNPCSNQASLTQLDSSLKTQLSLTWIAPLTTDGNVVFVATFVQNMSTYWVKVQGPSVIPQVLPPPPPPVAVATTSSTTPKPTKSININKPRVITSITSAHTQLLDTTTISTTKLTTPTTTIPTQLADTTISTTKLITRTTTILTHLADTTISTTKSTTPTITTSTQLADTTISTTKLTAITTTIPTNLADTTTGATSKPTTTNESLATGIHLTTTPIDTKPTTTNESLATGIHLTTTPIDTKDTTDQPGFGATCLDHGCGTTKGCFHDCNLGASWTFLVTWKDNGGDSVDFEMKAKIPADDNYWVSLGLSDDKKMGNDSVMDCIVHSGTVTVHSSYNFPEYSNELLQPDTFGITSRSGKVESGILTCSFSRVKRFDLVSSGKRKKRVVSSVDNFFDLDTDWYLFLAKGHTTGTTMVKEMHDLKVLPAVSMVKSDFQTLRDISSPETGSTKESPLSTTTLLQTMIPGFGATCLDHGCGTTKGCFHDCDHGASWTFLVTWKDNGGDSVDFEMKAKIPTADNYWVSLGLSDDKKMGNDSVMDCIVHSGTVTVHSSYNFPDKWNDLLQPDTFGITSKSGKVENGVLTCSFSRVRRFDLVPTGKRKKRVASAVDNFFDLETDWYLFFAKGHTNEATMDKIMHAVSPAISSGMADFQTVRDISSSYTGSTQETPLSTTTTMSPTLLRGGTCKDPACGRTKGCFHDCNLGTSWTFLITWADTGGNSINFEMKAKIPGMDNYWVSIGLSKDRLMGDDSVMDCSVMNGVITTYNSYNTKNAKWNAALSNATFGIDNKGGKVEDGIFTCSFSRLKTVSLISDGGRKKRAAVSVDTFFDLNEDWYLLFAFGRTAGSTTSKSIHSLSDLPKSSAVKADLQSMIDLSASKVKELLIRIHGILMIIAWVTLASIGIIVARFYKPVWPNSRLGGEKIWFQCYIGDMVDHYTSQIHRFCMVFVLLCTAASFVLIFVYINGYSVIESSEFQKSHPIIGIVVMSLTAMNPIMALFRPHPDDEKRPIFNFFHWGVGTSAHILAIINIFIGISLPKADTSQKVAYILWAYVAWQVFLGILLTVYDCCQKKEEENYETTEMIEMRDFSYKYSVSGKKKKVTSSVKPPLLIFHVLVILGLTVAIIVMGALESS